MFLKFSSEYIYDLRARWNSYVAGNMWNQTFYKLSVRLGNLKTFNDYSEKAQW